MRPLADGAGGAGKSVGALLPTALLAIAAALIALPADAGAGDCSERIWAASWTSSPMGATHPALPPQPALGGRTLRQRAHLSLGGEAVRVRISNEFGVNPLTIGAATLGLSAPGAALTPGSMRKLTFGGAASIVVPAGAPVLSDPIPLSLADAADVSVSLFFPKETRPETLHYLARERGFLSDLGDVSGAQDFKAAQSVESRAFLSGIDVLATGCPKVVVAFGDSITDGAWASEGANRRWPDLLAQRLRSGRSKARIGVVNQGLGGNMVRLNYGMQSGLARFDRDVAAVPGVTHVIVQLGVNDLGYIGQKLEGKLIIAEAEAADAANLIQAYRQLIERAHARGLKIIGATITPFAGMTGGYYSEAKEADRQAVNAWIRTSGAFDGVADFDRALRDPKAPSRLNPAFDFGDHLHPNDAGFAALAEAVDLSLFE